MEEQKTKEALELVQRKHKLIKCESERKRARTMHRLEASRAIGPWSGGHDYSSLGSCSSSLAFNTYEAMSASSRMAQDSGKAEGKSIDLEGEVEKLEVSGPWFGTEGDSVDPKGEVDHRSDRTNVARGKGQVEGR